MREQVEATLRQQRAIELLQAQFDALQEAVENNGSSLVAAAAEQGLEASQGVELSRTTSEADIALLKAVFEAPRSAAGQPQLMSATADNGDQLAFVLDRVEPATADQFFQSKAAFNQQLQGMSGQQDLVAFMQALRHGSEIVELR